MRFIMVLLSVFRKIFYNTSNGAFYTVIYEEPCFIFEKPGFIIEKPGFIFEKPGFTYIMVNSAA
jgi:hypothetical protein